MSFELVAFSRQGCFAMSFYSLTRATRMCRGGLAARLAVTAFALCAAAPAQTPQRASEVSVDPSQRYQVIEGFGTNFTGPYFRDEQKKMFDLLIEDLGVSMFRVLPYFVGSDWEVRNDNDDPKSANWAYYDERYSNPVFEAAWKGLRDLNARGIRPVLALMGPAPAWMVEESSPPPKHKVCVAGSKQGRLKPEMYEEFAETVVTLAVYARRKAKIEFDYFSPVNETDCYPHEGPRIDPEDMPAVLSAIARRLDQEGLGDVKLVAGEQSNIATDYAGPILGDKELMKHVGAFGVHTYGERSVGMHVEAVGKSPYKQVPVWLTEYGGSDDEDRTAENEWKDSSLAVNRRALRALNLGATALFYFNAFDDYEECMRRQTYFGLFSSAGHLYSAKKRYYATRQLFHFVAPGSQRIAASTETKGLTVSAFRDGAQGTITLVGVKEGGPGRIRVSVPASQAAPRTWDLYVTTREINCRKTDTPEWSGGAAEFELPEEAVFTLVGRSSIAPPKAAVQPK